jgi:hypothetical protein
LYHKAAARSRRYDESIMRVCAAMLSFWMVMLAGCGGAAGPSLPPLPMQVEGWKRAALEFPPVAEAPETASALGVKQWARTRYLFDGEELKVSVFAFGSETAAFEAQQKWPRGQYESISYKGAYFMVCDAPTLNVTQRLTFAGALESAWLKPPQP